MMTKRLLPPCSALRSSCSSIMWGVKKESPAGVRRSIILKPCLRQKKRMCGFRQSSIRCSEVFIIFPELRVGPGHDRLVSTDQQANLDFPGLRPHKVIVLLDVVANRF